MFRTLIDVPLWVILLEVGIPIAVILVIGALVALRSDRSDRSDDNLLQSDRINRPVRGSAAAEFLDRLQ